MNLQETLKSSCSCNASIQKPRPERPRCGSILLRNTGIAKSSGMSIRIVRNAVDSSADSCESNRLLMLEGLEKGSIAAEEKDFVEINVKKSNPNVFVPKPRAQKAAKPTKQRSSSSVKAAIGILTSVGEDVKVFMKTLIELEPYTWDEIMRELESRGARSKALEFFSFLQQENEHMLHAHNYVCIIRILGRMGQIDIGRRILNDMKERGMQPKAFPYTMLIDGYVKHGQLNKAFDVFQEMQQDGCKPTFVTYTVLIHACAVQESMLQTAMELYGQMKAQGEESDEVLYNCLVNGLINGEELQNAQTIVNEMKQKKIKPNVITYTNLLNAYAKKKMMHECMQTFKDMKENAKEPPNVWTYNTLINAYGEQGMYEEALQLYDEMERRGVKRELITYNIVISMYGKDGRCVDVENVLREMHKKNIAPNQVTYNTLLDFYIKHKLSGKAHEILKEMKEQGCKPNIWTYNILMASAGRESVSEAEPLYEDMKSKGPTPNHVTYSEMINMYGRHGLYAEAREVWKEMCYAGITPCIMDYSGLIEAYGAHGMHEEAYVCFQHMIKAGIEADTAIYTSLMDAYAAAGLCDKAEELLIEMEGVGLVPDAITYGVLVRAFIVAGRLQERLNYFELILDSQEALCRNLVSEHKNWYLDICSPNTPSHVTESSWFPGEY